MKAVTTNVSKKTTRRSFELLMPQKEPTPKDKRGSSGASASEA